MMTSRYERLVMARIDDEPALVLHTRPYRESSVLVDLLTVHHGRVAALLKGGRRRVQIFSTFHASWYGGRELVTLVKPGDLRTHWLTGDAASAGLYVNELIMRLVREREPVPDLFAVACWMLTEFENGAALRPPLRGFEKLLLQTLGYALSYSHELDSGTVIDPGQWYRLVNVDGFVADTPERYLPRSADLQQHSGHVQSGYLETAAQLLLRGDVIQAIADEQFHRAAVNAAARRLFRRCLRPLLGDRPLKSRELLRSSTQQPDSPGLSRGQTS